MPTIQEIDLAETQAKIENIQRIQDDLFETARGEGRDLTDGEWETYNRKREQLTALNERASRVQVNVDQIVAGETRARELADLQTRARRPELANIEYRSAGAYMADVYWARMGRRDAAERLEWYSRVAAHTITSDVPGLIPTPIEGPVIDLVDNSRPVAQALGLRPVPQYPTFTRPQVTQHVQIGKQTAEKTELASRKYTVSKRSVTVDPYGGYGNISQELIDWSNPSGLDAIIADFAGQYAQETENVLCDGLYAAAQAGPTLPTGVNTADQVNAALWGAAGLAYGGTKGAGRLIAALSPDMLGTIGPLFKNVNPTNAVSTGMTAGDFTSGLVGAVGNIPHYMSNGLDAGSYLVIATAAVEVYDQRGGVLQAVEPSVLGMQVGYYGYFGYWIVAAAGVIKIVKTP